MNNGEIVLEDDKTIISMTDVDDKTDLSDRMISIANVDGKTIISVTDVDGRIGLIEDVGDEVWTEMYEL